MAKIGEVTLDTTDIEMVALKIHHAQWAAHILAASLYDDGDMPAAYAVHALEDAMEGARADLYRLFGVDVRAADADNDEGQTEGAPPGGSTGHADVAEE